MTTNTAATDRPARIRRPAPNPLALRTETLHRLQDADLARVVGGTRRNTYNR